MRKTQTICTIGPASESSDIIEKLIIEGVDILRLNFSHASYEQFSSVKKNVDFFNKKYQKNIKILIDLQGPRMRVGDLPKNGIELKENAELIFSTDKNEENAIYINDQYLHDDIQVNHPLFLANGDIELIVTGKNNNKIYTSIVRGGTLHSRKAVNVPETNLTTRGLTEKDKKDVIFGIANKVDYFALSFVKDAEDIKQLREIIGESTSKIIAKIELKQSILNINEIINISDAIMVARGDLGIELPLEELPLLQKEIISSCKLVEKKSIVATQMLMSMVGHHRPTRAEVSDVANAVLDGASILMLSDETAFGSYPIESLQYLIRIINRTERFIEFGK
ncbi:hypothetical protein LBMAG33_2750 [Candidatus Levyibacteriota bacterium]|nr:hypothetical protein LBMAG33_2750 [Candidatus Levybacteria bacterium]